jgi:hypothetical protein
MVTAAEQVIAIARYLPINKDSATSSNDMKPSFEPLTKRDHDGVMIHAG